MKSNSYSINWSVLAFNGLIALLFGLMAIFSPLDTLKVIIMYFGIVMIIVGIAMMFGVYSSMKNKLNYGTDLISTIVTIGLGVVLSFFTEKTLEIFVFIVGIWAILLGIGQLIIMASLETKGDKRFLLYSGLFTIIFGILLFFNPFALASVFVVIIGVMSIIIGIVLISFAFKLKNLQNSK
ncbi:MAG TPA: DUF308 domain-containing protein [Bacteroidales bacterium]|jgi:uncharacterized membrane protein HdeD (DUF308 family)|nr:DUF308 domain-containing protein [Bacteroidales bacterium]|tara:strand:- start:2803 stop:3345 length:543 start_codon:yes stop_codon:yes gene_type:complete